MPMESYSWNGLNPHLLVLVGILPVSTSTSQPLPGSLGNSSPGRHPGVCQQTVYGPEKPLHVSLAGGLHNIFHIMKEILHSCKLAGKLANKAASQSKVLAYWNCW